MNSIDVLRQKRESGYGGGPSAEKPLDRNFKLTPEEMQAIPPSKDGSPTVCSVTGMLGPDGTFTVQSVTAPDGGGYTEKPDMGGGMPQ